MTQRDLSQIIPDHRRLPERTTLREQTATLLREYIVGGHIPPGTRLIEQEIADLLGVSRVPVRDALIELEKEGLVVNESDGRQVIALTGKDITELYQVRLALEKLAVELAARSTCPANQVALTAALNPMREAVSQRDHTGFVQADLDMHRLVWQQAGNAHLAGMLSSMAGVIFMFISHTAPPIADWKEALAGHEDIARCVNEGDAPGAIASIERHLSGALSRCLEAYQSAKQMP